MLFSPSEKRVFEYYYHYDRRCDYYVVDVKVMSLVLNSIITSIDTMSESLLIDTSVMAYVSLSALQTPPPTNFHD